MLLISITVLMAGTLGFLILNFKGPVEIPHVTVALTLEPGAQGWGTGDESIRATHLGGDPLRSDSTRFNWVVNGQPATRSGGALGGNFSDGSLTIGETYSIHRILNATDSVEVNLVGGSQTSSLISAVSLRPQQLGSGPGCVLDSSPPTVTQWTQSPADIVSSTPTGTGLTITALASDTCYGVNETATPTLWFCVATDCSSPSAFTQSPPMTLLSASRWEGTIAGHTWHQRAGQTLTYQLRGLTDLNGHSGTVTAPPDLVNIVSPTYLSGSTIVRGVLAAGTLANAQSATDGNAAISWNEASGTSTATLSGTSSSGSNSIQDGSGCSSGADCGLTSNDQSARMNHQNDILRSSPFTATSGPTISSVIIGFEGKRVDSSAPIVRLTYTGLSGTTSSVLHTVNPTSDTNFELNVTADRTWTASAIASMAVQVDGTGGSLGGSQRLDADYLYVRVTYSGTFSMNVELAWSQLPGSTTGTSPSQTLQLSYRVSSGGDVFNVEVWQGGSTWRTCSGQLTSTTYVTFSCAFTLPTEYQGGAPRVRIVDANPTSTTQTTVFIDYARVVTS